MKPRLTLKHSTGWFAAGREMQQALGILSDGAFKLYVYVCLHAERHSARLRFRHSRLAHSLGKSPRSISSYLNELSRQGVCQVQAAANQHQMGSIEIADRFWPYHKQLSGTPVCDQTRYIERVRQLLPSRACVQGTFSAADEKLAVELYQRHVPLERIERAYLLGCARKYIALLNHPRAALISSLHYFTALLRELEDLKVSPVLVLSEPQGGPPRTELAARLGGRAGWSRKLCATKSALSNPKQRRNEMMMTDRSGEKTTPILDRSRSLRRR